MPLNANEEAALRRAARLSLVLTEAILETGDLTPHVIGLLRDEYLEDEQAISDARGVLGMPGKGKNLERSLQQHRANRAQQGGG